MRHRCIEAWMHGNDNKLPRHFVPRNDKYNLKLKNIGEQKWQQHC